MCEDLGFDGAFVNEHHFTAINIQPSCNITATAIIMRTKRMKVGVIGNILPLRHPVQTAEEFAMMDCLSGGRFIGGIVRGVPFEYVSYNVDPYTSSERLRESFDIVHKCLTEELVDYDGKYWKLTGVFNLAQADSAAIAVLDAHRITRDDRVRGGAPDRRLPGVLSVRGVQGLLRPVSQGCARALRLAAGT